MAGIAGAIGFNAVQATERMCAALIHRGACYALRTGHMENGLRYAVSALGTTSGDCVDDPSDSKVETTDRRGSSYARAAIINSASLVLTRDFIGPLPLYYGSNDARTLCAFASERKALWAAGVRRVLRVEPGSVVTIKSPTDVTTRVSERCQPSASQTLTNITDAANRLLALLEAVTNELEHVPSGLAFSGGLDSSLLCGLITKAEERRYYVTGLRGSPDLKNAQHAARLLRIPLDVLEFSLTDVESIVPRVISIIESYEPMQVALGIPQCIVTQRAARDGYRTVITGQGADELFAGYQRYQTLTSVHSHDVNAVLAADVYNIAVNNLERDNLVGAANSVGIALPYLDPRVVSLGLSIDWTLKLNEGMGKFVLRKAAERVIPLELAYKQKKAMQYGTGVAAALKQLARNSRTSKKGAGCSVRDYLRNVAEENNIRVAA